MFFKFIFFDKLGSKFVSSFLFYPFIFHFSLCLINFSFFNFSFFNLNFCLVKLDNYIIIYKFISFFCLKDGPFLKLNFFNFFIFYVSIISLVVLLATLLHFLWILLRIQIMTTGGTTKYLTKKWFYVIITF